MEELYSVDPAAIRSLSVPVHGLIFLFKWGEEAAAVHRAQRVAAEKEASASSSSSDAVFFAAQVVPNACATQAILAVLLNRPEGEGSGSGLDLGHDLRELKAFAAGLDLESRGLALVVEAFPPARRSHAIGLWGASAALASGLGPPIGAATALARMSKSSISLFI